VMKSDHASVLLIIGHPCWQPIVMIQIYLHWLIIH